MSTLHLSREVKVYVQWDDQYWQIPVLDGFSFSQSTNTSEVTLSEMATSGNVSRRGRKMFNDSLSPAEWSFSTYARPYVDTAKTHAVEEILWAMMVAAPLTAYDADPDWASPLVTGNEAAGLAIDFSASNVLTAPDATIWFRFPSNDNNASGADIWYKLSKAAVNECSMDFDIDGITTINWSGMASKLEEIAAGSAPATTPTAEPTLEIPVAKITATDNFIRNRLTQLTLTSSDGGGILGTYNIVLTSGSISITNNVEHVTPSSLGIVNVPLEHTLGTRTVSGSFTCYLDNTATKSADLFEDLQGASSNVQNSFNLTFKVGGDTADTPRLHVNCPKAMLEIPTHSIEDVISMEVNFHGLGTDIADTDEVTIKYLGA